MKALQELEFRLFAILHLNNLANQRANEYWFRYGDMAVQKLTGKPVKHNPFFESETFKSISRKLEQVK